jgi:hypothetical protein
MYKHLTQQLAEIASQTELFLASSSPIITSHLNDEQLELWFSYYTEFAIDHLLQHINGIHLPTTEESTLLDIQILIAQINIEIERIAAPINACYGQKQGSNTVRAFYEMVRLKCLPYYLYTLAPIVLTKLERYLRAWLTSDIEPQFDLHGLALFDLTKLIETPCTEMLQDIIEEQIEKSFVGFDEPILQTQLDFLTSRIFTVLTIFPEEKRVESMKHRLRFHLYRSMSSFMYRMLI